MLSIERAEFDKQLTVMLGGFPGYFVTPERLESYWRGLQKMQMSSLIRVVDFVLSEEGPEKIPSVSALWETYRKLRPVRADNRPPREMKLSHDQHLLHLRRAAIDAAKRETMPTFKGTISRNVPQHHQLKSDQEWAEWDATLGKQSDEYWLPRARQLMTQWGERGSGDLDVSNALRGFGQ